MRWKLIKWITILAAHMTSILLKKRTLVYPLSEYSNMPVNSLGKVLHCELNRQGISFKPNLIRHDLKHILLGYEMDLNGELRLMTFLAGNRSLKSLAIAHFALCLVVIPEHIFKLKQDFTRGKLTCKLGDIDLQVFAKIDLNECRESLNIPDIPILAKEGSQTNLEFNTQNI